MDQQLEDITALQQFKQLINEKSCSLVKSSGEISIWGVTLQPDTNDDKTDAILRKFLRVKDFRVQDAFNMLSSTIQWRKDFCIEELLLEDDDDTNPVDFGRAFFTSGHDREGHPVCYTVPRPFEDIELYNNSFSDDAKRQRFLKWRILFMEKAVRKLDFRSDEISTMVHVIDMKNFTGHDKTELAVAFGSVIQILSNHYPGFFKTQIIINMPWWRLALHNITRPFKPQLSKSKLVFVGTSKSSDTLWEYIGVRQIPTRCEGLTKRNNEFGTWGDSTEVTLKRAAKCTLTRKIKAREREMCYGAELKVGSSGTSTAIFKKKID